MRVIQSKTEPLIEAAALTKVFRRGREQVRALNEISFKLERGEFVAVMGPSGSGKTTLLNLIGCMDAPTSGSLSICGRDVSGLTESQRTQVRRAQIGFVFQHFSLLPTLSVEENIALPALFSGQDRRQRVAELIERVGLAPRRNHRPAELSGGEMQRVAIARALVNDPVLLLADEPTGNLDSATGESISTLFQELNRGGLSLVVVTHHLPLAQSAGRQIGLQDGRLAATLPLASFG